MFIVLILVLIIGMLWGPQLWVKFILKRYNSERKEFPGTGKDYAEFVLTQFHIEDVKVVSENIQNYYDPLKKEINLSVDYYDRQSLTAIVVAAHEAGHAIQDDVDYQPLKMRTRIMLMTHVAEKLGAMILFAMPVITAISKSPAVALLMVIAGLLTIGSSIVVSAVTLPVEFNASFQRAMPVLKTSVYLNDKDLQAANQILKACALTYVANALASLLNVWRWMQFIRH